MDTRAPSVSAASDAAPANLDRPAKPSRRRSRQRNPDEIERFKSWLVSRGGELLVSTNVYELVRFLAGGETSIIYVNKKGRRTLTGRAQSAWDAFKSGTAAYRLDILPVVGQSKNSWRGTVVMRTLIQRDGDGCFYCGDPFSDDRPRTKEHLVATTHGGPNHISNMFLSCARCNGEAGHLSAPEKIRMRDRKRRGVGSRLLADALGAGLATIDPELAARMRAFLTPEAARAAPQPTKEESDV